MAKSTIVPVGKIDIVGLKKVGKGALIAGAGAFLTYAANALPSVDFGVYSPLVAAGLSVAVNFFSKLLTQYKS